MSGLRRQSQGRTKSMQVASTRGQTDDECGDHKSSKPNRFGLQRRPPAHVRREVRKRSKFGCVICRSGYYIYEHIEPEFKDANEHDPNRICCLCESCHGKVTRKRISKQLIKQRYEYISSSPPTDVQPPHAWMDFHTGTAELLIGGLNYSPALRSVLRYNNHDIIRVNPSNGNEPGSVSALFLDDKGNISLRLIENEWVGNTESWDIETVGSRLAIKSKHSKISLLLRLDPPGRIVIEYMDMRLHDVHVLASDASYAVGRYVNRSEINWMCAHILNVGHAATQGSAIVVCDPVELEIQYRQFKEHVRTQRLSHQELTTEDGRLVFSSGFGVASFPHGIAIARGCGNFAMGSFACGTSRISAVRRAVRIGINETMHSITRTPKLKK